uniref:Uncharacterized protein n=1 Tax=Biomphalaria glabrata TaxID=6526 RepID=A0A2C9JSH6_BIOGL
MRPSRQKEVITSHLHDLENVNRKLDVLRDSVTMVIQRAVFWLEEKDEASYLQIKQYLLERNSRFMQACIDIASDNEVTEESLREECEEIKSSSQPKVQGHKTNSKDLSRIVDLENYIRTFNEYFDRTEEKLSRLNEQFETSSKTLLKKIKQLEKKHTEQQKHIQDISQKQVNEETKYNSSFNACSAELHQASEFIQFKTESLSQKLNQCEERNEIIQKKQTETENNLKTEIDTLTKQIQSCNDLIKTKTEIIFGNSNENKNEIMKMCESNKEKEKKFEQILRTQDEMKTTLNQTSEHIEKELGSAKSRLECLESENETSLIKLNELERNLKICPKKFKN